MHVFLCSVLGAWIATGTFTYFQGVASGSFVCYSKSFKLQIGKGTLETQCLYISMYLSVYILPSHSPKAAYNARMSTQTYDLQVILKMYSAEK